MKKVARSPVDLMSLYTNHLRALYLIHQNNHWECKKSYSNHLLFQRLYEGVEEMVDEAAEKTIGVFGEIEKGDLSDIISNYSVEDNFAEAYLESSLKAEQDFQETAKKVYHDLKESSILTLGLDDMIMSHANKSEVHIYLLQQALAI